MSRTQRSDGAERILRLIAAFAAVYLIWGSTYLAIRFAIETLPPLLMAGTRFTLAGALLYGWVRWRGGPRPTGEGWRLAAVVGALMLVGGNGALSWAEQLVPSGVAALVIATVPIWMVVLEGLRPGGERPGAAVVTGLLLGSLGVAVLVGPRSVLAGEPVHPVGLVVLLMAAFFWAAGSLRSRSVTGGDSPILLTAMVMLSGGVELLAAGSLLGELSRLDLTGVTTRSLLALLYLVVFGSIVAYSAYLWLMRNTSPARVATYAYVNPVIALFLGYLLAGEALNLRTLGAAGLIVGSVLTIQLSRSRSDPDRMPGNGIEAPEELEGQSGPGRSSSRQAAG